LEQLKSSSLLKPSVSSTSLPIAGDLGRGPIHQSHVLEHRDTCGQAQVCSKGHQGSSVDRPCQPSSRQPSCRNHVLACTESATSEYSTTSQCLIALLVRLGGVKFALDGLRLKTINQRTYHSPFDHSPVTQHPSVQLFRGGD